MKKINIVIFLIVIFCISFVLVSCGGDNVYDCTHEYSNECDIDCNKCEQPREVSHLWVTNDADLCQYMSTCGRCGVTEGQDIEHVYTDENGNCLEKCLNCGKQNNQYTPNEQVNSVTWQFRYDYGFHKEGIVTLLVDYGILRGDFEGIIIPNDIVAGDTITINYTGSYIVEEKYPANIDLSGEVKSYSFSYADVVPMLTENLTWEMLLDYDAPNNYVILDRSGRYTTLDKYEGETIYLVEDQEKVKPKTSDAPFCISCMLAYNPRDLEDGIPGEIYVPPHITEQEAMKLASEHFYNEFEYELPPENFVYKAEIIEHWDTDYYHIVFSLEYIGEGDYLPDIGDVYYTYKVNNVLKEIEMIITNRR